MKFGGAALADGRGVRRAAELAALERGVRVIVVVSAVEGATDLLERAARAAVVGREPAAAALTSVRLRHRSLCAQLAIDPELCDRLLGELALVLEAVRAQGRLEPRERDVVLSFGERLSARIFARVLAGMGVPATPIDAYDLGLTSDSNHGRARPLPSAFPAMARALAWVPGVPVVTGFVAADAHGNLTTLGRNGSDLTAALVAEAAGACEVWFWKTVEGVMTADPRLVPDALTVEHLSYDQAESLGFLGAKVLFPDTLEPLRRARIPARVSFVEEPECTTRIDGEPAQPGVVAIACRRGLVRATLALGGHEQVSSEHSHLGRSLLAVRRVEVVDLDVRAGAFELTAVAGNDLSAFLAELDLPCAIERGLAQIAAVGATADEAARALHELVACGLEPQRTRVEPASARWIVADSELGPASRSVHRALFTSREPAASAVF